MVEVVVGLVPFGDGHQFYCRDSQLFEVGDLLDDAEIGAGVFHPRVGGLGEAAYMEFIDDRVDHGNLEWPVVLPVELVVGEAAQGDLVSGEIFPPGTGAQGVADGVQEDLFLVADQTLALDIHLSIEAISEGKVPFFYDHKDMPHISGTIVIRIEFQLYEVVFPTGRLENEGDGSGMS